MHNKQEKTTFYDWIILQPEEIRLNKSTTEMHEAFLIYEKEVAEINKAFSDFTGLDI